MGRALDLIGFDLMHVETGCVYVGVKTSCCAMCDFRFVPYDACTAMCCAFANPIRSMHVGDNMTQRGMCPMCVRRSTV